MLGLFSDVTESDFLLYSFGHYHSELNDIIPTQSNAKLIKEGELALVIVPFINTTAPEGAL